jgi:hemolysin III
MECLMLNKLREPVNGLSHYAAAILAVVGLGVLVFASRTDFQKQASFLVYGMSLTLLLLASAAYHLIKASPDRIKLLRRIDHSAIFILIAGTYTPICFNVLTGFWRWGLLSIIWAIALVGAGFKIAFMSLPRWFTALMYLGMGWLGVLGISELVQVFPVGAVIWLAAGGLFFTVGAVIYVTKRLNFIPGVFGFHEVWHLFVVAGCACHFLVMLVYVVPYPRL